MAGEEDIGQIVSGLNNHDIKLNVIAIDFCNEGEGEGGEFPGESESTTQSHNKMILERMMSQIKGGIFPAKVAMSIYKQFRKRQVHPVTKFKGDLEIGEDIKIGVMCYGKTRAENLPSLKKYSLIADPSNSEGEGKIKMDRVYCLFDDPDQMPIDEQYKIKAFKYGKQFVPVAKMEEDLLKYTTAKCLKVLGFTDRKKVKREFFMGGVDMVLPIPQPGHQQAFISLVHGMYQQESVMICRYVPRVNTAPKLAILTPKINSEFCCLIVNIMPTVEDIRDYQFQTLTPSTTEQRKAVGEFIDSLDLSKEEDNNTEPLKPSTTFNPVIQYLSQCIMSRSVESTCSLPPLDPNIANYVRPDRTLFERAQVSSTRFASHFDVKEVSSKEGGKKRVYWRDIITREENKGEEEVKVDVKPQLEEEEEEVQLTEKPNYTEPDLITTISTVDPIADFNKMVKDRHTDRVIDAMGQISKIILRFVRDSFQGNMYDKAIDCLTVFRGKAVSEDEAAIFNDFMFEIKGSFGGRDSKHTLFWNAVGDKELYLITSDESISSLLTGEDAIMVYFIYIYIYSSLKMLNPKYLRIRNQSLMKMKMTLWLILNNYYKIISSLLFHINIYINNSSKIYGITSTVPIEIYIIAKIIFTLTIFLYIFMFLCQSVQI